MLNFDFLHKGLGIVSAAHFVYDLKNFKINPIFLIQPFLYMIKKPRQKLKYLENEKSFKGEMKNTFHQF